MAVHWDCKNCAAYHEIKPLGDDDPKVDEFRWLRDSLIYALLVTGFPPKSPWKITEANVDEVFTRLNALEKIGGAYRTRFSSNEEIPFTYDELKSMIGLAVNAGNKSKTEFLKTLWNIHNDRVDHLK